MNLGKFNLGKSNLGGTGTTSSGDISGNTGIVSGESFGGAGSPPLPGSVTGPIIGTAGIVSLESFGGAGSPPLPGTVVGNTLIGVTGIVSAEAFGADGTLGSISGPLTGHSGIASREAFGGFTGSPPTPYLSGIVTGPIVGVTGISSLESFGGSGSPPLPGFLATKIIGTAGIASAEFFPTGRIFKGVVGLYGITSQENFGTTGAVLGLAAGQGNFALYLGGVLKTSILKANTLSGNRQLNFEGSLNIQLDDLTGAFTPQIGSEIILYYYDEAIDTPKKKGTNTWDRVFAGTVYSTELSKTQATDTAKFWKLQCSDYAAALSRRILNQKFAAVSYGTLPSIMEEISTQILEPEGITYVDRGDPGVVFPDIEFAYTPMNEVMDKLAEICGWEWQIDYYKNLYIFDRPSQILSAPFDLTQATVGADSDTAVDLRVTRNSGLYRNRQMIKTNFSVTSTTITKTYTCGHLNPTLSRTDYSWPVATYSSVLAGGNVTRGPQITDYEHSMKVSRLIYMKLNSVTIPLYVQIGGAFGAEVFNPVLAAWQFMQIWAWDLQFFFNIMANAGDPYYWPQTGDTLEIQYEITNEIPQPVTEDNAAQILARQVIEGGTGLYESVEELQDVSDRDLVIAYAQSLLARFSVMGCEVDFNTFRHGLAPGQEITVDLAGYGLSSQLMNVESLSYRELSKRVLAYSVKVSNQIQQRDALTAFHRLVKRLRKPAKQVQGVVTWDLATTYPGVSNPGLSVGASLGNAFFIRRDITIDNTLVYFKTPSAGADIRLKIRADGVSIFPSPGYIVYPAGSTAEVVFTSFVSAPLTLAKGTKLEIDVLQVGSTTPGKDGVVHLAGWT